MKKIDTLIYLVFLSPPYYSSVMKRNVTPVTLVSEKAKTRILNTLFKVKLLVLVEKLAALLKRDFLYAFLGGNFQSNCSSEFLLHCIKNEVFHWGFFQWMWPHPHETVDLVIFTEEIIIGKRSLLCTGSFTY